MNTTLPSPAMLESSAVRPVRGHWWLGGVLLVGWMVLWNRLRVDWSVNDQYAYGWFVPALALALFGLRWKDRPMPAPPGRTGTIMLGTLAMVSLALLLPIRLVEEPNGDWRMLSWTHAGLLAGLSLLAAGWCGGKPWVRHFAFPVGFLLLAIPWPSVPEQALVQGLQRGVASLAAGGMNLLGIPAEQQGNLIRVRDQLVGVNEACSGIRSLQTVLMAGLFLGELSRFSLIRRAVLLVGGVMVAMLANVFRSSLLVWITAQHGAAAMTRYHDAAGVSVLVIVFAGLLFLNGLLEGEAPTGKPLVDAFSGEREGARWVSTAAVIGVLAWMAAVEIGTEGWYQLHESGRVTRPSWTVSWHEEAPGFQKLTVDDVTRSLLRYDEAKEARWRFSESSSTSCTAFFFRWEPGRTSTTLAAMHQPATCLPASGLQQVDDGGVQPESAPGGFTLPVHHYKFQLHGQPLFVYYIIWQDQTGYEIPTAMDEKFDRYAAVRTGRRNLGQQTLELAIAGAADARAANLLCQQVIAQIVRPKG